MRKIVVSPWDINIQQSPFHIYIYWKQTCLYVTEYNLPLYTKEGNFAITSGGEEAYENIPLELVM